MNDKPWPAQEPAAHIQKVGNVSSVLAGVAYFIYGEPTRGRLTPTDVGTIISDLGLSVLVAASLVA